MGQGGYLDIYNATQYDWHKTYQHSYQIDAWNFPDTIPAFTSIRVYVEFDESIFHTSTDDAGDVDYELVGCPAGKAGFRISVIFRDLLIRLTEFPAKLSPDTHCPVGTNVSLGWRHDGVTIFVLAGEYGNLHVLKTAEERH